MPTIMIALDAEAAEGERQEQHEPDLRHLTEGLDAAGSATLISFKNGFANA